MRRPLNLPLDQRRNVCLANKSVKASAGKIMRSLQVIELYPPSCSYFQPERSVKSSLSSVKDIMEAHFQLVEGNTNMSTLQTVCTHRFCSNHESKMSMNHQWMGFATNDLLNMKVPFILPSFSITFFWNGTPVPYDSLQVDQDVTLSTILVR